jgi:hypothetical protein
MNRAPVEGVVEDAHACPAVLSWARRYAGADRMEPVRSQPEPPAAAPPADDGDLFDMEDLR